MLTRWCWLLLLLTACSSHDDTLTVVFGGDVMLDRGVRRGIEKKGAEYFFDDIQDVLTGADFAVVNLECPVTRIHQPLVKKFVFRAEPDWLLGLKQSGVTHLNMSNNHSNDQGREGIVSTATNIKDAGLLSIGFGANQPEACSPVILKHGSLSVAVFTSVLVPLENWMYLPAQPDVCQATVSELAQRIKQFKMQHPTTHVVVTLHWGVEYQQVPTVFQRQQAGVLIGAGADAILGHHPHVVQSFEWIQGKPVFFSLGNLVFDNQHPMAKEGMLVQLTFKQATQTGIELVPYRINGEGKPLIMDQEDRADFLTRLQKYSDELSFIK